MACRFPGAPDLAAYWRLLREGVDAIGEVPPERWDVEAFYDPDTAAPGKIVTRWLGRLEDIDRFDAAFFGISPREANHVDPQQRLMLETAWHALEDAGIPPLGLAGSSTGVFIATLSTDYATDLFTRYATGVDAYSGTGTTPSLIAARVSYFLDLRGPSLTIDTACSGSLAAIHLASECLRRGECTAALAGGVNLVLRPDEYLFFSKSGALSPDGRCKPFDARANGIVRGDGVGVLVLKPLSLALADGDHIRALIVGGAINQDGRSTGVMAPNRQAQEELLRTAYRRAGIEPWRVQYIEAHGTGTNLGDPVEANALGTVLGAGRDPTRICALGSVKSNIGHTEAAAGVAGAIKTILAFEHRQIPPTLHYRTPNPLIPFGELKLRVQHELGGWPSPEDTLIAGVSGFGIGGTNAHIVLQEPPQRARTAAGDLAAGAAEGGAQLLTFSARNTEALRELAGRYRQLLQDPEAAPLAAICAASAMERSHLEMRLAAVAASRPEAAGKLEAFLAGRAAPGLASGSIGIGRAPQLAWVFSGQGSHGCRMGWRLYESEPSFARILRRCDEIFAELAGWSLLAELAAPEESCRFGETAIAQPAIFAVQSALADLWRSWGLVPDAIVGQSLGEAAAAWAAGALSLEDAARVVFHRSRLMQRAAGQGGTALVGLPADQARLTLAGFAGQLFVAGATSPASTVISGETAALARLVAVLEEQGVFARALRGVDVAFHCPQMDPLLGELAASLAGIAPRPTAVKLVSTVTGAEIQGEELTAEYWCRNLRQPFLFSAAVEELIAAGCDAFLEIGPHAVLGGSVRQILQHLGRQGLVVPSLRRGEDERAVLLASLGELYVHGQPVSWPAVYSRPRRRVRLPGYPWQRRRFWLDQLRQGQDEPTPAADGLRGGAGHPLLGLHLEVAHPGTQHVWERDFTPRSLHWLDEHRVQGMVVLPAAAHLEMVRRAGEELFGGDGACEIRDVTFEVPLMLRADGAARRVQVVLDAEGPGQARFQIFSRDAGAAGSRWTRHGSGRVAPLPPVARPPVDLAEVRRRCRETVSLVEHYRGMQLRGLDYGPTFQVVTAIQRREGEALARLQLPAAARASAAAYGVHPALLDGAFQSVASTPSGQNDEALTVLPVGVGRLRILGPVGADLWCHSVLRTGGEDPDEWQTDLLLTGDDGRVAAEIEGLRLRRLAGSRSMKGLLHRLVWQPRERAPGDGAPARDAGGWWLLLADEAGVARDLEAGLEARGEWCILARRGEEYRLEDRHAWLDPRQPEHFQRLLRETVGASRAPCRGIVHLWSLDAPGAGELSAAALESVVDQGPAAALWTVQALLQADWQRRLEAATQGNWQTLPRLRMVTTGAQPVVPGEPVALAQAPLWGLGRVIAREHSEMWAGLVDLDPAEGPEQAAGRLLAELDAAEPADEVCWRGGRRYLPSLEVAGRGDGGGVHLRADASYLITGGLGGLGLLAARWMADHGARRLVLAGRGGLPARERWLELEPGSVEARRVDAVRQLEALGVSVHPVAVDVADEAQLAAFLARFRREGWPPLRGVFHAAGALSDQLLARMSREDFETAWRPKALAAWLLHAELREEPLDFFVLYSSVASAFGSFGQGNYAAGNAFLDALAHHRQNAGLPALSINWGPWSEVGMAARMEPGAFPAHGGLEPIPPAEGLDFLERAMATREPQVLAARADWRQWAQAAGRADAARLVAHLVEDSGAAPGEVSGGPRGDLTDEILGLADAQERRRRILTWLGDLCAAVMRLETADLDPRLPLVTMGFDSILVAEVRGRIRAAFGVEVPLTEMLMGASIERVAAVVLARLQGEIPDERGPAGTSPHESTAAAGEPSARVAAAAAS